MLSRLNLLLIAGLMHFCHLEAMPSDIGRGLILQVLKEANENEAIRIELLKSCPEAISDCAEWIYDEDLYRLLHEEISVTLVAFQDERPVGMISLKTREAPDLADLESGPVWIDGLHVKFGDLRVEQLLSDCAVSIAKRMGYREICF